MELVIKGKNIVITDALKDYAREKLGRVTHFMEDIRQAHVELTVIRNPSVSENQIVEVTLHANGTLIRGEEASTDMYASIDLVSDKIARQLKRHKQRLEDRRHARTKTVAVVAEEAAIEPTQVDEAPQIVRIRDAVMMDLTPEDAAYQLDLSGKDFLTFHNRLTGQFAVLYHRRDGNYGLIEPSQHPQP